MFKKGRKREAKGLAVVYFIIGLIILLIILAVIYFALVELDYSDRMRDPEATMRAYVETTPEPEALGEPDAFGGEDDVMEVDLTEATPTPEPTPTPTPEPTPTPTPEPTPTPTPIPSSMISPAKTSGFSVPAQSSDGVVAGITKCSVSVADNDRYMYIAGYGYGNTATFDAANCMYYVITTQTANGKRIAYQATNKPGISGDPHTGASCLNPGSADFECVIDVGSEYGDSACSLGLMIAYKRPGARKVSYAYYAFPTDVSFTVAGGKVTSPIAVAGSTEFITNDVGSADEVEDDMYDASTEADVIEEDDGAFEETSADDPFGTADDPTPAPANVTKITSSEQLYYDQMLIG